jgi:6-phosphogluconolactonase
MELLAHGTAEAAAEAAASRIAGLISQADGHLSIGMAGGSAAEAAYRSLRGRASGWDRVDAWLSDERWVPPDHERSNGRMIAETLLDHVGARFTRPRWSEYLEPGDVAAHYEAHLRSLHGAGPPDLLILGMGSDGHTASLFPDTAALDETSRWFVANLVPSIGEMRLTATFPLLWRARLTVVVAYGAEKAPALKAAFDGDNPAGRLAEGEGTVEWYVDREAASGLA